MKRRPVNTSPPPLLPKSPALNLSIKKKKVATVANMDHLADLPIYFKSIIDMIDIAEDDDLIDTPALKGKK